MVHRIAVNASDGWVDTGVVIPPSVPLHIVASRMVVTGGSYGTDAPMAYDLEHHDSGGIYPDGNRLAYPEGSYGNNSRTMAESPGSVMTVDPRGALKGPLMSSNVVPFALVAAMSPTNPGWSYPNGIRVNRRLYVPDTFLGGRLWLCMNDYQNCILGSNSGFFEVLVGWPEAGEQMWSGSIPWNSESWHSSGLDATGRSVYVYATGLGRWSDSYWLHPEGQYSQAWESNPTYSPLTTGTWFGGIIGPPRSSNLRAYELCMVASASPGWGIQCLNCDREASYTSNAVGSGTIHFGMNVQQGHTSALSGSTQVIVYTRPESGGGGGGSATSVTIHGTYDVNLHDGRQHSVGSKGY